MSALWAVAEPAVAATIERAHRAAVKDALMFIRKACPVHPGPALRIRQVNVQAWLPSRSPTGTAGPATTILHTHVAVASKVQTLDGRWLSIDGRVLFHVAGGIQAYNWRSEQHLRETLGVRFAERPGTDPAKRPIREIVGVDPG